ncbi:MAG: caspase family protein [Pseudorhodoplanes sp.]|nr:caspase family protein [Pseudorhodoplanes sp.]
MRRWVPVFVLVVAVGWTPPAAAEKRIALVIGINDYDNLRADQQLKKAVNDSKAVGDALAAIGFEVLRAENVGRLEFNRIWQRFLNRLEPGDTMAFFFAGHGVEVAGSNFLLARDVPRVASGEDDLLKGEAIALARLLDDLRGRRPKMSLLILDACRDNPFPQPGGRSVGGSRGLARVEAPEGTFVMFSAGTGEAALDRLDASDGDANSVYTRWLIRLMPQPGLSLPDLAQELRRRVRELAARVRHRQTPAYYDEVVGRYCLGGCEGGGAATASLAIPPELARPASPAPNEPLPAEVPINASVLRLVETHPFFVGASPVLVASYNTQGTQSTSGNVSLTSKSDQETSVRWLRQGLVRYDITSESAFRSQGTNFSSSGQLTQVWAANGLIQLGHKHVLSSTTSRGTLLRIENMKGRIFPIEIGNRFSYDVTYSWPPSDEYTDRNSCEVRRKVDAKSFHSKLTGAAYVLVCDKDTVWSKSKFKSNGQWTNVFFEAFGLWLDAEPLSPQERTVSNQVISPKSRFTYASKLKSFALAHQ